MEWKERNDYHTTAEKETELQKNSELQKFPERDEPAKKIEEQIKDTHFQVPPDEMNLAVLQDNLAGCLRIVDDEVMKGYISRISDMEIIPLNTAEFDESFDQVQFFRIMELVYEKDEFSVHKLSTVFHTLSNKPCTVVLMIQSDGYTNQFYLGVRSLASEASTGRMRNMLEQSLLGLFPGSRIEHYPEEKLTESLNTIMSTTEAVSGVTCVADYKRMDTAVSNQDFIQGLEKFVQSMHGKKYTAILIANNLNREILNGVRRGYENIYSQISPFADMQLNFTSSSSQATSQAESEGRAENTNQGIQKGENENHQESTQIVDTEGTNESEANGVTDTEGKTEGQTHTDSESETKTKTNGFSLGANQSVNGFLSVIFAGVGASVGLSQNFNHSVAKGRTTGSSDAYSSTQSQSHAVSRTLTHGKSKSHSEGHTKGHSYGTASSYNYSVGCSLSMTKSRTLSNTLGSSKSITLNAKNKTIQSVLERLEKQMKRLEECESVGMWDCAAYFLGEIPAITETAASVYYSIMSGNQSGIETSGVHSWYNTEENPKRIEQLKDYVLHFVHPEFCYYGFDFDQERPIAVNPSSMVSTNELALHMGLPRHAVRGLPVVEHAAFAQEIIPVNHYQKKQSEMSLGKVFHLGEATNTDLKLDIQSLSMHTFVTGSTGSGKSNAVYRMLGELRKLNIPFLVIEPAKGEYRRVFPEVRCFGTNPLLGELLQINPFSFPQGVHVLEHIDRLVEIFNVCWPMYAAMPAVLKAAVERAYVSAGWNVDISRNMISEQLFPTFEDVLRELKLVIDSSEYSNDTKGDYVGSLSTRLQSLTNGIYGRIFSGYEQNLEKLFDNSAIIDISRIGSTETKSLIMGVIVLKLQEYRSTTADDMNSALKHVTVLEEAHNLLKRTSTEQNQESSNLQGKSVEMLTNAIAEIRTYGEGFIIADQAPNLLDMAAIRNTNTKLIFKLPEESDRKVTGKSIGLTDGQIMELSKKQ